MWEFKPTEQPSIFKITFPETPSSEKEIYNLLMAFWEKSNEAAEKLFLPDYLKDALIFKDIAIEKVLMNKNTFDKFKTKYFKFLSETEKQLLFDTLLKNFEEDSELNDNEIKLVNETAKVLLYEIKAPTEWKSLYDCFLDMGEFPISIFLGGSIEMGTAENWQKRLTNHIYSYLKNYAKDNELSYIVFIVNPRRDDWDSSWEQSINNPYFREQVEWELMSQELTDINIYYFVPGTKSPITLLELGLFRDKNVLVYCPDGFWRKGNVDIVASRYNIKLFEEERKFFDAVIDEIDNLIEFYYNNAIDLIE